MSMTKASMFLIATMSLFSSIAQAESLKNSDFVKYSEGQRHWWYLGAFTSLGHLAYLEDEAKGQCVLRWLYDEGEDRTGFLLKSFKTYPDNSPTAIIIAILRKDCGAFLKKD
jgi:hypothetical protein